MAGIQLICQSLFCLGLFVLPFIMGISLFASAHQANAPAWRRLRRMAGWLTIKPYAATPLWFWLMSNGGFGWDDPAQVQWVLIIPAAGLTLWAVLAYRALFTGRTSRAAWALLAFDTVRWMSTFLLIVFLTTGPATGPSMVLILLLGVAAVTMPFGFALMAMRIIDWEDAPHDDTSKAKHAEDERGEVILLP